MTDAVTGTSEAHLQAEVNGKTFDAQLNRMSSSWETLTAAIGASNGVLASFIKLINDALNGAAQLMRYGFNSSGVRLDTNKQLSNNNVRETSDYWFNFWKGKGKTNTEARNKTIEELRQQRKIEKEEGDKLVARINHLRNTKVSGWEKSVKDLKEQLAKRNNAIRAYNAELERLNNPEKGAPAPVAPTPTGGGKKTGKTGGSRSTKSGPTYTAGSLKDYEAQLSKLNAALQGNVDVTQLSEEQLAEYSKQFSDLYAKINAAKEILKQFELATAQLGKTVDAAKQGKLSESILKPTLPGTLGGVNVPKSPNMKLIEGQVNLNREIERTNKLYGDMGSAMGDIGALTMNMFAGISNTISAFSSEVGDTSAQIGGMGQALSSAGQAVNAIGAAVEDKGLQIGGLVAQTIGNLALSFALALKQAGELGPIGWAAFGIAGLAQLAAMIAQIKSMTSGYASGGIIPGNSYHGDQMYVRANAGEMILTQGQQSRLFRMLDGGVYNGGAGQVEFVINGSQLKGVLNNYSRKTGKLA